MEWIKWTAFWLHTGMVISQRINSGPTCEPIKVDLCNRIGYNLTGMPNLAQNSLQADAKMELETFTPLMQFNCANECATYYQL